MRIAIIGCGITGGNLSKWLNEHTDHWVIEHDPYQKKYGDLDELDAAFLCVPVPTLSDGDQDYSNITEYEYLRDRCPVFIRSTILPHFAHNYCQRDGFYHVPEFLTERRAHEDMCNQSIICSKYAAPILRDIFIGKEFIVQENERDCAVVKYAHNCFGAMKVNFFNNIYNLSKDYSKVREGILSTGYINVDHTNVPGPDGKRGYGGKCFLKDMYAFADHTQIDSLQHTVKENYTHRKMEIGE